MSVDTILAAETGQLRFDIAATRLRASRARYMGLTKACHGSDHLKPKSHWLYDIADQFDVWFNLLRETCLDQIYPDTFPLEWNHIGVKHLAERICNMATFEASLLSSLITLQRRQLLGEPVGDRLCGTPEPIPNTDGMMISDRAVVGGMAVGTRGFVFTEGKCGEVRS